MIDKEALARCVEKALEGTDAFLVDVQVAPDNLVRVEIDSQTGVDIDTCAALTRSIEKEFDRDAEDYELEVGSSGLTSPFKVKAQYDKNVGNVVEVLTKNGRKLRGELKEADSESFTIDVEEKVKREGQKRPVIEVRPVTLNYDEVKYTKYLLEF